MKMSATVDRIYCIHTLVLAVVDISSRHRLSPFSESLFRTVLIFSARPHDMYSTTSGSGSSNLGWCIYVFSLLFAVVMLLSVP